MSQKLWSLLRPGSCLIAPGVFDGLSTRLLARQPRLEAAYLTGFGLAASHLGAPDAGIATYSDFVGRVRMIAGILKEQNIPLIADADTGFGGLINVRHTVRGYEDAGAAAIQLEDQAFPKKCGHVAGRRVVPMPEMVRKIQVASDCRNTGMLIIARTDARTSLGLNEALRRAEAYLVAGAHAIFVESPESEAEMETIGRAFGKSIPLVANMVEGGRTPILSRQRLAELGFQIAIYPSCGFLAASRAMSAMYGHVLRTGSSLGSGTEVFEFEKLTEVLGLDEVREFEKEWGDEGK
jgi:2-methylisocitrate lyase-like PEP mutase family enzyme